MGRIKTIEYAIAHWENLLDKEGLSLEEAQELVDFLWEQYRHPEVFLDTAPIVVFVNNEPNREINYSRYVREYWKPKAHRIELIPNHRDVVSVLHELAHALAVNSEHGQRWRRQFCQLLSHMFEPDAQELLENLEAFIDKYLKNA